MKSSNLSFDFGRHFFKKMVLLFFVSLFFSCKNHSQEPANNQTTESIPIIPFNTNFWNYWDHYWISYLDNHPKYEAIELTAYDNPENPTYKLLRVFLTEKSGSKKQYFYLNDSAAVKRSRANSFFSDITYFRTGEENRPQNLHLEFTDKDNEKIEWTVNYSDTSFLVKHQKGLTPSIHSVGYILLYHLRTKTASTVNEKVLFNGNDYSFNNDSNDPTIKRSWYNKDVYSAVVIFGKLDYRLEGDVLVNSWGRKFSKIRENLRMYKSNYLAKENHIYFELDRKNQIQVYQQKSFGHSFKFNFEPALPNAETAKMGQIIKYYVSFDRTKKVMEGEILVERKEHQIIFHWNHNKPKWARKRPFKSVVDLHDKGYTLRTYDEYDKTGVKKDSD